MLVRLASFTCRPWFKSLDLVDRFGSRNYLLGCFCGILNLKSGISSSNKIQVAIIELNRAFRLASFSFTEHMNKRVRRASSCGSFSDATHRFLSYACRKLLDGFTHPACVSYSTPECVPLSFFLDYFFYRELLNNLCRSLLQSKAV